MRGVLCFNPTLLGHWLHIILHFPGLILSNNIPLYNLGGHYSDNRLVSNRLASMDHDLPIRISAVLHQLWDEFLDLPQSLVRRQYFLHDHSDSIPARCFVYHLVRTKYRVFTFKCLWTRISAAWSETMTIQLVELVPRLANPLR